MYTYIIVSTCYRFLCGALLLAINWGLASRSNDHFSSLLISTIVSFVPALFVPFLTKKIFQNYPGSKITAIGLAGAIFCCFCLSKFHTDNTIVVILNFIIWIFFFLLESSWEMWFASTAKRYQESRKILKFSSISMTTNQVALMAGPIAAPFIINLVGYTLFYIMTAIFFTILAVLIFKQKDQVVTNNTSAQAAGHLNAYLFISLLLIWPVLGSFNFMLPVQVTLQHGKMVDVGILDACMGIGMALIGIFFSINKNNTKNKKIIFSFIFIFLGGLIWSMSHYTIINLGISVAFLGIGFGGSRILLRSILATDYESADIGKLASRANACALPVLACVLTLARIDLNYTWLAPFILALLISIFIFAKANSKIIEKGIHPVLIE